MGGRRGEGAKHSRGKPPTRIGNAAIANKPPADTEHWGVADHELPEDHLGRFVVEALERIGLSILRNAYAGRGSTA